MDTERFFFGELTRQALKQDPIEYGAGVSMVLTAGIILFLFTYYKKWNWLFREYITTLDHKKIGIMYFVVSFVMLFKGLIDALMMRTQQALSAGSNFGYLGADHFQQIFTAHGATMIFFVGMGIVFCLFNLLVPLQIGARDVAFPFLNAISFWLFAAGAMYINLSLMVGKFSGAGWVGYPPLSGIEYNPGVGVDYWIWCIQIAGIGSLLSGINFFVTILKMRTKGMTFFRLPIFTWSALCTTIMILFAFPILTATLYLLTLDRYLEMRFFTPSHGGNLMMFVNLIWAWGHPEVYILILPAFGMFSEIVSTFSKKKLFGYHSMVIALCMIATLSFLVWLHHFFTMGAGPAVNSFFAFMTMLVAIPTGVKLFNWLFTMYRGSIELKTPMLYFLGFILIFTIGGVAGITLSIAPVDFQMHNSLFLVAHFHTVIIGGVVFGFFASFIYLFPKFTGIVLEEKWGVYGFWAWFTGFLLAFIPLYFLGFMGATRRLNHYSGDLGWQPFFIMAFLGILTIFAGVIFQIIQVVKSVRSRNLHPEGAADPWDSTSLLWFTSSPPKEYNFARLPLVESRDAFQMMKEKNRALFATDYEDIYLPKNSLIPFLMGINTFVLGFALIWHIYWLIVLTLLLNIALLMIRMNEEETDKVITKEEVLKSEGIA